MQRLTKVFDVNDEDVFVKTVVVSQEVTEA